MEGIPKKMLAAQLIEASHLQITYNGPYLFICLLLENVKMFFFLQGFGLLHKHKRQIKNLSCELLMFLR